MKRMQRSLVFSLALVLAPATIPATTSHAQPRLTAAQLAALTPLDPGAVPRRGTFWFLQGPSPGQPYPPLPCPPGDLTNAPIYALGGGQFLIDDSQVDYAALRQQQEMDRALSSLEVQYGLRRSEQNGGIFSPMGLTSYTADDLWLELIAITNATGYFVVHPPAAEATNGVYDLFVTTNLSPDVPGLNLTNWLWLLRTDPGETNLIVPNLTADTAFFMLGRTNDTDGDGMSDAYEHLVSHTSPTNADSPIILSQPISQTVEWGDTITFTVVAEGPEPLTYQWFLGTNAIPGKPTAR